MLFVYVFKMKKRSVIKTYEFDYDLPTTTKKIECNVKDRNLKYTITPFRYDSKEALVRLDHAKFNPIWTGLFANLKILGGILAPLLTWLFQVRR